MGKIKFIEIGGNIVKVKNILCITEIKHYYFIEKKNGCFDVIVKKGNNLNINGAFDTIRILFLNLKNQLCKV